MEQHKDNGRHNEQLLQGAGDLSKYKYRDILKYKIQIQEAGDKPNVVVATFETSALELLFPFPQLRGSIFQPIKSMRNISCTM